MKRWLIIAVMALAATCMAQVGESTQGLVDAARVSKSQPVKAKRILNDDTVKMNKSGIPDISLTTDNSSQITSALRDYDSLHTPLQTEQKAREWYDAQDSEISRTIDQAQSSKPDYSNACSTDDYKAYSICAREQQRRAMTAQQTYNEARRTVSRMNQVIRNVRSQLQSSRLNFAWMVEHPFPYEY
jgi:hypothetical protein